jgi:hypothetical protein
MRKVTTATTALAAIAVALASGQTLAGAQSCTTQARMTQATRSALEDVSLTLARAVQAGDAARVQSMAVAELAGSQQSFAETADLIHATGTHTAQDTPQVTQLYLLDAQRRATNPAESADFSCLLAGTTAETDFSIPGLPAGTYAFSMVEATGPQPWLMSFLLRQEAGGWKLAGFYPHARTAAGHDGGWYWKTAYDDARAGKPWLGWLLFGEADQLLRPASFVTSTKLDSLQAEARSAAPPELAHGVGKSAPLVVKGADGSEFRFTQIAAQASGDRVHLELMLHLQAEWLDDPSSASVRNQAAAKAFVAAHPEVRSGFDAVVVFAESEGHLPFTTEQKMGELP